VNAAPPVCVGAVAVDDGRLLLIRRGTAPGLGSWSLPGGRVEPGETVGEAVVREVLEETGLEGLCGPLLGWVERIDEAHHFVILDFVVEVLDAVDPTAGDDAAEAAWVSLSEVAEMDLVEGLAEFLHEHGVLDTIV
jgi:8-oxo-dGTP diphosphatase